MAIVKINDQSIFVQEGTLLQDVLAPQHRLEMLCGGHGKCGKCRIKATGQLSTPCDAELRLVDEQARREGIRLACMTRVLGDCEVFPQQKAAARVLVGGDRMHAAADPLFSQYGVAVDIGTTTLAACLYAADGSLLAQTGRMNPQAEWGADVISRIGAALAGKAEQLAHSVRQEVDAMLCEMARQVEILPHQIDGVVITGNTAMLYLLTQTNPACLSHAPFENECFFDEMLTGSQLGLSCRQAAVYLPRCMASFVGADTTTALLASGIADKPATRMLVDIGTNGEIVFCADGKILCSSTAAGPAFEGAELSMGMPGRDGAVDHVRVENGTLQAHVIGNTAPAGICGSGVVDALAAFLETEQMDETGRLTQSPATVCAPVSLTQKDVRKIQLAKSAVASGIQTLVGIANADFSQVEELAVAGGFGSYLDINSAGTIGLIPSELAPRVNVIGNAALKGAAMILLDRSLMETSRCLAQAAQFVELSTNSDFLQAYAENMLFE